MFTAQDVEFLQEQGVMDYSMLVGHFSLPATTALNEIRTGSRATYCFKASKHCFILSVETSGRPVRIHLHTDVVEQEEWPFPPCIPHIGQPYVCRDESRVHAYYITIIDFLQVQHFLGLRCIYSFFSVSMALQTRHEWLVISLHTSH